MFFKTHLIPESFACQSLFLVRVRIGKQLTMSFRFNIGRDAFHARQILTADLGIIYEVSMLTLGGKSSVYGSSGDICS
jgi:hypothetical protein